MKLTPFNPADHIETADDVAEYLWAAAECNDRAHFDKAVKDALAGYRRATEAETIAKVVEWLRGEANKGKKHLGLAIAKADEKHQKPELWAAGIVAINNAADAIERGEWKDNPER